MRSHLTAFGVGAGLSLLAAGAFALIAPQVIRAKRGADGDHIVNISHGDSGSFQFKTGDRNISAEWKGDFDFAADGRSLNSLQGRLEVVSKEGGVDWKAVFEPKDGVIAARVFKDDEALDAGEAADRKAADLSQLFARTSGVGAKDRVAALIAAGGKARAIEEISALIGEHAVGAYIEALAEATALSDDDVRAITGRVKGLESDYAKRKALAALLVSQELSDAAIAEIVEAAKSIEGDHELRLIIEELADGDLGGNAFSAATALVAEIDGDHEVRLAVSALLGNAALKAGDAARLLEIAAASIDGDHEMRLVVEEAESRLAEPAVAAAVMTAIGAIESAHEKRHAIEGAAAALDDEGPWVALIGLTTTVNGDHDRRLAIEALNSEAPETDEIRAALRKAAESIGSDHDRRLALEALE